MILDKEVYGVYWDAEKAKWHASIEVAGQRLHIGYFDGRRYYVGYYTSMAQALQARDLCIVQNELPHKS